MRSRRLPILLTAVATALLAPAAVAHADDCAGAALQPDATNTAQVADATLCLLNGQRAAAGLPALTVNAKLTTASTAYAADLVGRGFFDHVTPDGVTLTQRLARVGYAWSTAGENLAWGSQSLATPAAIVDAWMHSAGHRANILDRDYREIGLGIAPGAPKAGIPGAAATYVTDFGTAPAQDAAPAARPAAPATARAAGATARAGAHRALAHRATRKHAKRRAHRRHATRHHRRAHHRRHAAARAHR
jgi:uncharacterized protein YkwD